MIEEIIKKEFKEVIGQHRYNSLKKQLDKLNYNSEQELDYFVELNKVTVGEAKKMVKAREEKFKIKLDNNPKIKEYSKKVDKIGVKKEIKSVSLQEMKEYLFKRFDEEYFKLYKRRYSRSKESIENIKPLIYYFIGDFENFKNCEHVITKISTQNKPLELSLNKGLLIIGDFGNGKTSTMTALSRALKGSKARFDVIGAKEMVRKYEDMKDLHNGEQSEYFNYLKTGRILFDDITKEKKASSYGVFELVEDVIQIREKNNKLTHATMNYKEGDESKDVGIALNQIGEKYGGYIYDRVNAMFNIIEFTGKSYRK